MEMSALLWNIMTWCHHYQITLKSQAHFRMPQCDGLPFIQSNKQNGHCIHRCPNKSGKWFILRVDLFAIHPNHKIPLFVAPVPDQHGWDIDAQNIIWSGLTSYAYPPTALLSLMRQLNCLISVIPPGWPGMPWFWNLVQLSTEIPLQLPVSRTILKQSHNYVFHSNPQHLNLHTWCLGVDSCKNKASQWRWQRKNAAPQRSLKRTNK